MREYENKRYTDEEIEYAKNLDIFNLLYTSSKYPIIKKGTVWVLEEHDSLNISDKGKGWYWFSEGKGSKNPIRFFQEVYGMSFPQAMAEVLELDNHYTHNPNQVNNRKYEYKAKEEEVEKDFHIPKKDIDNKRAIAYLCNSRGLDYDLVLEQVKAGNIYQDEKYKNVVFLGKDYENNPVSAFKRTTLTNVKEGGFKSIDEEGSSKNCRFRIENKDSKTVNVFESEIDLLSYMSMQPAAKRNANYISLGGTSIKALETFMEHNPQINKINICSDNDIPGNRLSERITEKYMEDDKIKIFRTFSETKDFNSDLTEKIDNKLYNIKVMDNVKEVREANDMEEKLEAVSDNLKYIVKMYLDISTERKQRPISYMNDYNVQKKFILDNNVYEYNVHAHKIGNSWNVDDIHINKENYRKLETDMKKYAKEKEVKVEEKIAERKHDEEFEF